MCLLPSKIRGCSARRHLNSQISRQPPTPASLSAWGMLVMLEIQARDTIANRMTFLAILRWKNYQINYFTHFFGFIWSEIISAENISKNFMIALSWKMRQESSENETRKRKQSEEIEKILNIRRFTCEIFFIRAKFSSLELQLSILKALFKILMAVIS